MKKSKHKIYYSSTRRSGRRKIFQTMKKNEKSYQNLQKWFRDDLYTINRGLRVPWDQYLKNPDLNRNSDMISYGLLP